MTRSAVAPARKSSRDAVAAAAELARHLAGTEARRAAEASRIRELTQTLDDSALIEGLVRQRMLALGMARLEALDRDHARLATAVAPALVTLRRRSTAFLLAGDAILGTLDRAGIPALALKGPALARRLYGAAHLREFSDLDLLVDVTDLARAVGACAELGYVGPGDPRRIPVLHHELAHPAGALPALEVHWRMHWYEPRFAGELLARSTGQPRVPEPVDELAALLLFFARDGFAGVRLAADVGAWWDRFGSHLDRGALADQARRYPELAATWDAAARVAEATVGLPGRWLMGGRSPARRSRLAARLANPALAGPLDQIAADVTLVDGLCSPPGGRRAWVRRHVLCDEARLRDYYRLPARGARPRLWLARLIHPPKTVVRYLLALRRVWGPGTVGTGS